MSEDEWESVTAWIFEERMSIIGTVTLLLRIRKFSSLLFRSMCFSTD